MRGISIAPAKLHTPDPRLCGLGRQCMIQYQAIALEHKGIPFSCRKQVKLVDQVRADQIQTGPEALRRIEISLDMANHIEITTGELSALILYTGKKPCWHPVCVSLTNRVYTILILSVCALKIAFI